MNRIEQLRKNKTPDENENLLLNGELGKIRTEPSGYQYIVNIPLSWLVVEVHEPEFIENRPKEYIVHHIDGNKLNNAYLNLQVMSRTDHNRLHRSDPKFVETEKARGKKQSESLSEWWKDPENARTIEARGKKHSETKRKSWITPDSNVEFFESPFTVKDYAKESEISPDTAWYRLRSLLRSKEIVCRKDSIRHRWRNVYRSVQ